MSFLLAFVHSLGFCSHRQTYRERRELNGVSVLHFVCEDCGHAVPAVPRTEAEHRRVVEAGAIRPTVVRRHPSNVVAVAGRRRSTVVPRRPVAPAAETESPVIIERAG